MSEAEKHITGRRGALIKMFKRTGVMAMGGFTWGAFVEEIKASDLVLRPPGAQSENEFIQSCIKCGLCVEACPYDTLKLAKPEDNMPIGTPYMVPREIPCYMCTDVPCVPVCPTESLSEQLLMKVEAEKGKTEMNINNAKMGLAVIDQENCLAYWGIRCDACYRTCPLINEALTIEIERNERTGKHAFFKPVINSEFCTGCGMCEHACITEKPAVFILPIEKAQGHVSDQYVKGWDEKDEMRVDTSNYYRDKKTQEKTTLDYLNDTESLFDE